MGKKLPLLVRVILTATPGLLILCITAPLVLAVSGKPTEEPLSVRKLHQSTTCGSVAVSQWITTPAQAEKVYKQLFHGVITDTQPKPPDTNYSTHALLLVSMGQKTTGGYSVTLASEELKLLNAHAQLSVHWTEAKPGMITIQMLTNPCLLVDVSRGAYEFIDVVDSSGKVRQSIELTAQRGSD